MNILITGGASGLGESITRALAAEEQDRIFFTYNKSHLGAAELSVKFPNVVGIHCDFESESSLESLLVKMEEIKPTILINNAFAGFEKKHFHKMSPEAILNSFRLNVIPVIKITQKALLLFRKERFGKIITILSSAIINKPPIGWSEYVAQKNYLLSLHKSWAIENAAFHITSNVVSPAFMETNMNSETDERIVETMRDQHPLKQLLKPDEVAESVRFLTRCSQQINGSNFIINAASDVI